MGTHGKTFRTPSSAMMRARRNGMVVVPDPATLTPRRAAALRRIDAAIADITTGLHKLTQDPNQGPRMRRQISGQRLALSLTMDVRALILSNTGELDPIIEAAERHWRDRF